jgi:type IV secretory pathway TrbD component
MSEPNRVALSFYSIAAGATSGGALAAAGTASSRPILSMGADPSDVVLLSGLLGVALAAGVGWGLSRGIAPAWRRSLIGVGAAFVGGLLGLAAVPLDLFFPQAAVLAYLIVLLAGAVFATRFAGKARSGSGHVAPS